MFDSLDHRFTKFLLESNALKPDDFAFTWVVDFPLFKRTDDAGPKIVSMRIGSCSLSISVWIFSA